MHGTEVLVLPTFEDSSGNRGIEEQGADLIKELVLDEVPVYMEFLMLSSGKVHCL